MTTTEPARASRAVPGPTVRAPSRWAVSMVRQGKPFATVAARRAMVGRSRSRTDPSAGRFRAREVADIIDVAFDSFHDHIADLPEEPTVGSRQNVMLAALTLCFMQAIEKDGVERAYAIELTGDVTWRFYRHWGALTQAFTRVASRDPVRRLRMSVNGFLSYPFGRPGYQFDDVPQVDGRSLNMVRCPVADFLGRRDAADLCAESWCNLDYALADMWGARLERTGTLVAGASCCDFRFRAQPG